MKRFIASETHDSKCFARFLQAKVDAGAPLRFSHIPLEGARDAVTASNLQRMGVRAGVPDYLLIVRGRVHFVELKRLKGGRLSPEQTEWLEDLSAAGVGAHVCKGWQEAVELVSNLLAGG